MLLAGVEGHVNGDRVAATPLLLLLLQLQLLPNATLHTAVRWSVACPLLLRTVVVVVICPP